MASSNKTSRGDLICLLRGKAVQLPDLKSLIAHWPSGINVHKKQLETEVDERMTRLFPAGKRLKEMRMADAGLFGASWWPYVTLERLKIVTHLSTWLFAWDDETDSIEYSDLITDIEKASMYRRDTVFYIHTCLFGDPKSCQRRFHPLILDFKPIGDALRASFDYEQLFGFYQELVYFIDSTHLEQKYQIEGHIPSVEEYLARRMGSSAVRVCLALTEFGCNIKLPRHLAESKNMSAIWNATNVIISIMNDILSIKKEVAQGQVDSMIPILFLEHGSLERAVQIASGMVSEAVHTLDEAANALRTEYSEDYSLSAVIEQSIAGCKYACTGNLNWSLASGRFQIYHQDSAECVTIDL